MRVKRRLLIAGLSVCCFAALSAAAYARTVTGTQNPQFRVTVTITPDNPVAGQTIVATVTIVNRTRHNHKGSWQVAWEQPTSGISAAATATFKPGVDITDREHARVTATSPRGRYTIFASVQDASRGTAHASASVIVR
jgi:uncharacterized protein (DUF58 family)